MDGYVWVVVDDYVSVFVYGCESAWVTVEQKTVKKIFYLMMH